MENPPLQFHNVGVNVLTLSASFMQTVTLNTFKFRVTSSGTAANYNQLNTLHSTFWIVD